MSLHRAILALLIAVCLSIKMINAFKVNRGFIPSLKRVTLFSLSSSSGTSSSSSQSRRSLSMQSVSDWTEQKVGFGDSFRPEISVTASTTYDFSGDMLVVPFYKPKDLKEDTEITKVSSEISWILYFRFL